MKKLQLVALDTDVEPPARTLLVEFDVDDDGSFTPLFSPDATPPVINRVANMNTEAELRDHYAYSSFFVLEDVPMEPRGSMGSTEPNA